VDASAGTLERVWWFGWYTAFATGLGALPFFYIRDLHSFWQGMCNALAAGMMFSASVGLIMEGLFPPESAIAAAQAHFDKYPPWLHVVAGMLIGVLFMVSAKKFLESHEEITLGSLDVTDSRRVLLIVAVMTLHSLSEGVSIGVAFGSESYRAGAISEATEDEAYYASGIGTFVSATLAIHNIPEGFTVCSLSLRLSVCLSVSLSLSLSLSVER
jgi:ZIP family zinc transporter